MAPTFSWRDMDLCRVVFDIPGIRLDIPARFNSKLVLLVIRDHFSQLDILVWIFKTRPEEQPENSGYAG